MGIFMILICGLLAATEGQEGKRYFCGRVLAEKMALLCLDESLKGKRSVNEAESVMCNTVDNGDTRAYHDNSSLKVKLCGIVDECCLQPCNIETLLSYC